MPWQLKILLPLTRIQGSVIQPAPIPLNKCPKLRGRKCVLEFRPHSTWPMGRSMKRNSIAVLTVLFLGAVCLWAADAPRDWKSGTLLESEKVEVPQGSIKTSNTEGTVKKKNNNKADYSETTTTRTTDDSDTFQVYTIQGDTKTYIA